MGNITENILISEKIIVMNKPYKYAVERIKEGDVTNNLIWHSGCPYDYFTYKTRKYKNDAGGYYLEEYKIWKVKLPDGKTKFFKDAVFNAPWQVGGNSGQVRSLLPLTKDEALTICKESADEYIKDACIKFVENMNE